MEKIPNGRYTKELREEAARLVLEDGLSAGQAAQRQHAERKRRRRAPEGAVDAGKMAEKRLIGGTF